VKALFIGGSGNISYPVSELVLQKDIDLYHLNRGNRPALEGVKTLVADIKDSIESKKVLQDQTWDVVVNWIAFSPEDIMRDFEMFSGKTRQYIFISSASVYQKPPVNHIITESTPLGNPFWEYSRNKIACEELLIKLHRENDFPVTIVRPSHTYYSFIPVPLGGGTEYTVVDRIRKGRPIVVHDDGTSLWTITHATDFAKGFVGLMNNQRAIGEAFHITSDEALSWNRIYETLAGAAGCNADMVHIPSDFIAGFADAHNFPSIRGSLLNDKAFTTVFDNSKIKSFVPEFTASIPFSAGIKQTLEWFESDKGRMLIKEETQRFMDELIECYRK
jgi:nucleoside-diphosphate-sugar epimerase